MSFQKDLKELNKLRREFIKDVLAEVKASPNGKLRNMQEFHGRMWEKYNTELTQLRFVNSNGQEGAIFSTLAYILQDKKNLVIKESVGAVYKREDWSKVYVVKNSNYLNLDRYPNSIACFRIFREKFDDLLVMDESMFKGTKPGHDGRLLIKRFGFADVVFNTHNAQTDEGLWLERNAYQLTAKLLGLKGSLDFHMKTINGLKIIQHYQMLMDISRKNPRRVLREISYEMNTPTDLQYVGLHREILPAKVLLKYNYDAMNVVEFQHRCIFNKLPEEKYVWPIPEYHMEGRMVDFNMDDEEYTSMCRRLKEFEFLLGNWKFHDEEW